MQSNLRQILSTVLLIAIFGGAYYAISYFDFFSSARVTREQVEARTAEFEKDVTAQLAILKAIDIDGAVFTNAEYNSLVDITVILERPLLRRVDPFAAL